jgi:hypothetical protein
VSREPKPTTLPRSAIGRAATLLMLAGALCGCGSQGSPAAEAVGPLQASAAASATPGSCPQTVLDVLGRVLLRVYREGVFSERTASARALITHSPALRAAVQAGDVAGARAAAEELIATGHMTNLRVTRGQRTLVDVGGAALTPLGGTLPGLSGEPIADYLTSVWSDRGFIAEAEGLTQGAVSLRQNGQSIAGSFKLPRGALAAEGALTHDGVHYQYTSFPATVYPAGTLRVYLLRTASSIEALCGQTSEDTVVNTLKRVATLIYQAEGGPRTLPQIRRVQDDPAMLAAVASRDPVATRAAIFSLLNHHIVRMRVSAGGKLLQDVGGPFVLQPVSALLRLHGRVIGSFVLSIQDDEGYLRLTHRLAGLDVLMYMSPTHPGAKQRLVKNSLGPSPGSVPASGPYTYRGHNFQVFTVEGTAFPSGPLTIRVLVPIPYV